MRDFAYSKYRLPLNWPLTAGGGMERAGLLIRIDGAVGEAAPLPGLHRESLAELPILLEQFNPPEFIEYPDCRTLLEQINSQPGFSAFPPSLRFGIESAYLVGAAARLGVGLAEYLWPGQVRIPRSVALFSGSPAEAANLLAEDSFEEYSGVKIKVGRGALVEDCETIRLFRHHCPDGEIRLDANRSMSVEGALAISSQVEDQAISFIEEPFETSCELEEYLGLEAGLPVALDESLVEAVEGGEDPMRAGKIKAWVIKPSCLGLLPSMKLIEAAGLIEAVVSSSFESSTGQEILKAIASGSKANPGLGTDRWFAQKQNLPHQSEWLTIEVGSDG